MTLFIVETKRGDRLAETLNVEEAISLRGSIPEAYRVVAIDDGASRLIATVSTQERHRAKSFDAERNARRRAAA
jgi:hypothetical protein